MTTEPFDPLAFVREQAAVHARLLQTGMEIADGKYHTRIRGLEKAYQQAILDPETKIPSYLMAVIVGFFAHLPERYVDAKLQQDKADRHSGRPDQDLTTHGTPMVAGR